VGDSHFLGEDWLKHKRKAAKDRPETLARHSQKPENVKYEELVVGSNRMEGKKKKGGGGKHPI